MAAVEFTDVSRYGMDPPPGDERLQEAIIYVAQRLEQDPGGRGAVKLNKVLWWADFEMEQVIPYETSIIDPRPLTGEDRARFGNGDSGRAYCGVTAAPIGAAVERSEGLQRTVEAGYDWFDGTD